MLGAVLVEDGDIHIARRAATIEFSAERMGAIGAYAVFHCRTHTPENEFPAPRNRM